MVECLLNLKGIEGHDDRTGIGRPPASIQTNLVELWHGDNNAWTSCAKPAKLAEGHSGPGRVGNAKDSHKVHFGTVGK